MVHVSENSLLNKYNISLDFINVNDLNELKVFLEKLLSNEKIYKSEMSEIDHNLSIAYLLKSYGRFYSDVVTAVDVYTQQCSVMVTSEDVALMACTLANGGVNPKTKKSCGTFPALF